MRATSADTIAAVATPPGAGAIAIVRLSGTRAVEVADSIFSGGRALADCPTHTAHHGRIVDADGTVVDDVLATVMRAPTSYTTEDMVEFGCHGGPVPARRVLEACLGAGARPARRGEYTMRAFLGGRMDLVQAEAVADIVAARTRRGLESALGQLEGGLSGRLMSLRAALLDFRAEVESLVDFADDDIGVSALDSVLDLGRRATREADALLERCDLGMAVREGASVAIVGRPNVGKSSLMNALLMRERSIVTASPGTTRDAVEELLHIDGVPVRLIDTAGWRDAGDEAERAGVARARAAAGGAERVLLVIDSHAGVCAADTEVARSLEPDRVVVAANKSDLRRAPGANESALKLGMTPGVTPVLSVSALTGEGLDDLRAALFSSIVNGVEADGPVWLTNVRHVTALRSVRDAVDAAVARLAAGGDAALVAADARRASESLGTITGETTPEDVLERIFERFCVGK